MANEQSTGYAIKFDGHGTFTPEGRNDALDVDAHNRAVEAEELAIWATAPERWQVYVIEPSAKVLARNTIAAMRTERIVETWLGTVLGVITRSSTFRNPLTGTRTRAITFRATNGATYYGRYGADWSQLCRVRKVKSAR